MIYVKELKHWIYRLQFPDDLIKAKNQEWWAGLGWRCKIFLVVLAVAVAIAAIVLAVVFTNKSSPGLFKNTNEACGVLYHDDDNSNDCS